VFTSVDGYSWMFMNVCKCLQVFVDVRRWLRGGREYL
jgi:hypothetical protein